MNIGKHKLPNFFVKKKGVGPSNHTTYITYINDKAHGVLSDRYMELFSMEITAFFTTGYAKPGKLTFINLEGYYHINRIGKYEKYRVVEAIFDSKSEEVINDI